jgi:single-strand DNA-binding protein
MARSVNKAILLGNLGQTPEIRTTPTGRPVTTLNLATTERYKDKNGEWKDMTEWHRVVVWDRQAESIVTKVQKGSKVYIEGKITNRSYDGKDGVKRYVSEVVAAIVIPLETKPATRETEYGSDPDYSDEPDSHEDINHDMDNDSEVPF